jgi:hypothetical protein
MGFRCGTFCTHERGEKCIQNFKMKIRMEGTTWETYNRAGIEEMFGLRAGVAQSV